MTVLQAIKLNIYTLRTAQKFEATNLLVYRACTHLRQLPARQTDGDDLRTAGIWMDGDDDFSMSNPMDDLPFRLRQIASRIRLAAP